MKVNAGEETGVLHPSVRQLRIKFGCSLILKEPVECYTGMMTFKSSCVNISK